MLSLIALSFVIICFADFGLSHPPVPVTPDGYTYGSANASIHVDIFYDLLCSDCKNNDPILSTVIAQNQRKVKFTYHLFPLPYHHNAYFVAQSAHAIAAYDFTKLQPFKDIIFEKQDSLLNEQTEIKSPTLVKKMITEYATMIGVPARVVSEGLKSAKFDGITRVSWKYACSRYISGTPTFVVNGIQIEEAGGFSVSKWNDFLASLK